MDKPSQNLIEQWMAITTGPIHYTQACDGQFDREYWPHLRVIFHRMCGRGVAESVGGKDGLYRLVENSARPIDWQALEKSRDSGLILPFDLRKYVFIYPDTTTVIAGSKSSGKTGFLYRTVALNMNNMNTVLLTNLEGGIGMLRDRFNAMDIEMPNPAPFKVIAVYDNYHDYIKEPNTLYVIDYIDAPEGTDFFKIGYRIQKVDKKLQGLNSVAVIGLQKPSMRDTAFGGEQTLRTATLYIALDSNKLKIVDAKVSTDKKSHPKNRSWTFTYEDEGTRFDNIEESWMT